MKRVVLVGFTLACGLSLAGCSGDMDAASGGEPDLGITPVVTSYADIEFPLDKYLTQPEESLILNQAQDLAIRDCMARYGLEYPVSERMLVPDVDRPIGVISPDDATRFGYKSPRAADIASIDAAKEKEQPLPPAATGVLNGTGEQTVNGVTVPADGCAGEARQALAHWNPSRENLVIGLAAESYAAAEKDSRVRAAFTKWSQCMSKAGYDYRAPWAAHNNPRFATKEPTADEIATAQADVSCRNEVKLNGTWVAAIVAYQEEIIDTNRDDLNQRKDEIEAQLSRAEMILNN